MKKISKRKWKKILELDLIIKNLPEGETRDAYNMAKGLVAGKLAKVGD